MARAIEKHKLILEVEVTCPTDSQHPEKTIDATTILKSLEKATYAVCDSDDIYKLTADMKICKATMISRKETESSRENGA